MTPEEYFEIEPNFKHKLSSVLDWNNTDKNIARLIEFFGPCVAYSNSYNTETYYCFENHEDLILAREDILIKFRNTKKTSVKFIWRYDVKQEPMEYGLYFLTENDMVLAKLLCDNS